MINNSFFDIEDISNKRMACDLIESYLDYTGKKQTKKDVQVRIYILLLSFFVVFIEMFLLEIQKIENLKK